jgi:hypothetical protein
MLAKHNSVRIKVTGVPSMGQPKDGNLFVEACCDPDYGGNPTDLLVVLRGPFDGSRGYFTLTVAKAREFASVLLSLAQEQEAFNRQWGSDGN